MRSHSLLKLLKFSCTSLYTVYIVGSGTKEQSITDILASLKANAITLSVTGRLVLEYKTAIKLNDEKWQTTRDDEIRKGN